VMSTLMVSAPREYPRHYATLRDRFAFLLERPSAESERTYLPKAPIATEGLIPEIYEDFGVALSLMNSSSGLRYAYPRPLRQITRWGREEISNKSRLSQMC